MKCVFCKRAPAEMTWFIAGPEPDGPGLCDDCLSVCYGILVEARWKQETPAERYARLAPLAARKWAQRFLRVKEEGGA